MPSLLRLMRSVSRIVIVKQTRRILQGFLFSYFLDLKTVVFLFLLKVIARSSFYKILFENSFRTNASIYHLIIERT